METEQLCAALKERIAADVRQAEGPGQRNEVLIEALYELSRSLLPRLGPPRNSSHYQACQAKVLDLISFIAIPLIRGAVPDRRGVAVLSEIAEGCQDPLLKKKLNVYAQELLAKATLEKPTKKRTTWTGTVLPISCSAGLLALYVCGTLGLPVQKPVSQAEQRRPAAAALKSIDATAADPFRFESGMLPEKSAAGTAVNQGKNELNSGLQADTAAEGVGAALPASTRVRIIGNRVLVPVTLKNGGETVQIELVLDTGATRSVIHDTLSARLHIDLRQTASSMSEVADGRLIASHTVKIDSLTVGPFVLAPADIELIAYRGVASGRDGLLGMDFLGKHRYQIDMEHELIRWF